MKRKVIILGGGPNRIGQGIEFDYCCVHACFALKEAGIESVMINSNPETVSTDYDTSDRLYFEPLTYEDVMNIVEREKPLGVIVQLGGQTPLNLTFPLEKAGVKILGTSSDSIDISEDRERFKKLAGELNLLQPPNDTAVSLKEAEKIAETIGYPVLIRPSYVLGGRAMEIVYDRESLLEYMARAVKASPEHPVLIDKFLEDAIEIDVDCIADGETAVIAGIMEHIEEAGIHSGDSACVLPPNSLSDEIIDKVREYTYSLAKALKIKGLMNIQYAVKEKQVYILEVNPRASRTIPFVSKVIGVPLAKLAVKIMLGKSLKELGFTQERSISYVAVKEAVFPFARFPGVDAILGPEMHSTGEVMGIDKDFGTAFLKSQIAAGQILPKEGNVLITVNDADKKNIIPIAKELKKLGFKFFATSGTAKLLKDEGIKVERVNKLYEARPHIVDMIKDGKLDLIINTPAGKITKKDETLIRSQAVLRKVPLITTIAGARASVQGIKVLKEGAISVKPLQEYHNIKKFRKG